MTLDLNKLGWIALVVVIVAFAIFLFLVLRAPADGPPKRPIWDNDQQNGQDDKISELEQQLEAEKRRRWELGKIALQNSDPIIRGLASEISKHPKLLSWMINDNLITRFVSSVDNVSRGESPRDHLLFMSPKKDFSVNRKGRTFQVDPMSYKRYDLPTDVFCSLDIVGSIKLYQEVKPLLDEAYRQLGYPNGDFQKALEKAIINILRTPVVENPIVVQEKVVTYEFSDPLLENLSPAQKQVIRLGAQNTRRLQRKLREFALALGMNEPELPDSRSFRSD